MFDEDSITFDELSPTLFQRPYPIWSGSSTKVPDYILKLKNVIYKFKSPSNKSYIGQTKDLEKRFRRHQRLDNKNCRAFYSALSKYGFDEFEFSVLAVFDTRDQLDEAEVFAIASENTICPNGYNLTTGGGGAIPSDETRAKISASHIGKIVSSETKAKLSKANIGKRYTEKTRNKMSTTRVGMKHSSETRAKIGKAHAGKIYTVETRVKMSKAYHSMSEETRAKMCDNRKRLPGREDLPKYIYIEKRKGREANPIIIVNKPGYGLKKFGSSAPFEERKAKAIEYLKNIE